MAEEGITVAVRLRPLNQRERQEGQCQIWACLPQYASVTQLQPDGSPVPERSAGHTFFTYDKVFGENSDTPAVYEATTAPLVQSVLQGINGTVFAYGQTSSGKTFTMQGYQQAEGMLYLAARDIFEHIAQCGDRDFLLRVSFVEIYNENVRDLLTTDQAPVNIREDPRKGVYIDASEKIITSFDQVLEAQRTGELHRRVESTAMNERSSRSHTIFRIVVESRFRGGEEDADGAVLVAALNLVDLAGSESVRHTGATGQRAKEGGKINQSLLSLSRVIHSLSQGGGHVNFRDSKLTRILQPSLSGNARMAVVCCVTPAEQYLEESRSTLQFAARAKMVRTHAVVNEVLDDRAQLHRLKKELTELKEQQRRAQAATAVDPEQLSRLEQEKAEISGRIEELQAEREQQNARIERLKVLVVQGGKLNNEGEAEESEPKKRTKKRARGTWCPGKLMESLAEVQQEQRNGKAKTIEDIDLDASNSTQDVSGVDHSFQDDEQQRWQDLQVEALKRKNEMLQEKLMQSEQQYEELQHENQRLLEEVETSLQEHEDLSKEHGEFKALAESLQGQLEGVAAEIEEARVTKTEQAATIDSLTAQLEEQSGAVSAAQQEVEALRMAVEEAQQAAAAAQEQAAAQLTAAEANIAAYEERLQAYEDQIADKDEATGHVRAELASLQALLQEKDAEMNTNTSAVDELQKQHEVVVAGLQEELAAKMAELEELRAAAVTEDNTEELEALREAVERWKQELQATEADNLEVIKEYEQHLAEANKANEEMTNEVLEKDQQLQEAQAQVERLAEVEAQLQEVIARELALQAELTAKAAELEALQANNTELASKPEQSELIEQLQQEVERLKEEVHTVEEASLEAITEYEEQLVEANKAIGEMTDDLMSKEEMLQQAKGQIEQLQQQLNDASHMDARAQLESGSMETVNRRLEQELGEAQDAVLDLTQKLENQKLQTASMSDALAKKELELEEMQSELQQSKLAFASQEQAASRVVSGDEAAKKHISQLSNQVNFLTDEKAKALAELEQVKEDMRRTRSELSAHNSKLETTVQDQEAVIQKLRGQLADTSSEHDTVMHLRKHIEELRAEKTDSDDAASRLLEKVNELNDELYTSQQELKKLSDTAENANLAEAAERIEELELELEEAELAKAQLETDLNEVNQRLTSAQSQKADIQGEWERTCNELDELRQRLSDTEHKLAEIQASGSGVDTHALVEEVAALREASHAADSRVRTYHEALEESKAQVLGMQDRLQHEQQTAAQLRAELEEVSALLEEELKTKEEGRANDEETDALLEEMNTLAEEKLRAESHVMSLKDENNGLRKQLAEYDDKSAKEQRMLMSMAETEMANLQQTLEQKEKMMQELTTELERQRAEAVELATTNDEVKRDLSSRRDALRESEMEVEQLRQDVQFRDESLNDKEESLAAAQNEIYRLRHDLQAMAELQTSDVDGDEQSNELVQQLKEQLRSLQFEVEQKNQRILRLEEVKMTKDKLEKLQKMKDERKKYYEENKALKQEIKQLKSQSRSSARSDAAASDVQEMTRKVEELQRAKEQLSEKLRKYAQHSQDSERERIAVLEVLKRAGVEPGQSCEDSNIDDSAVEESLADLVNVLSTRVRNQANSAAAISSKDTQLQESEDRAARYLADLQEVQGQKLALEHRSESLQKRLFDLRDEQGTLEASVVEMRAQLAQKDEELDELKRQSTLMQTGRSHELHTLEEENLELMQENKGLRKELLELRAQVEVMNVKGAASRSAVPGLPSSKVSVSAEAADQCDEQENVKPSILNTSSSADEPEQLTSKRTSLASLRSPAGKGSSTPSDAAKRRRKTREALVDLDGENQQECQQS